MRLTCLFLVGIAALGCKGDPPAKPAERGRPVATPEPTKPRPQAQQAPDQPTLPSNPLFDAEARDAAWAQATEQTIHSVAPKLTDVTCKRVQCRATLSAASEAELVGATEKLQSDDSLKGIDGVQNILLDRPEQSTDTHTVTIYVQFDRE